MQSISSSKITRIIEQEASQPLDENQTSLTEQLIENLPRLTTARIEKSLEQVLTGVPTDVEIEDANFHRCDIKEVISSAVLNNLMQSPDIREIPNPSFKDNFIKGIVIGVERAADFISISDIALSNGAPNSINFIAAHISEEYISNRPFFKELFATFSMDAMSMLRNDWHTIITSELNDPKHSNQLFASSKVAELIFKDFLAREGCQELCWKAEFVLANGTDKYAPLTKEFLESSQAFLAGIIYGSAHGIETYHNR